MQPGEALRAVDATIVALRAEIPEAERIEFDAGLAKSYGAAVETAGPIAVGETVETGQATAETAETVKTPETELEKQLPDFLDPNKKLDTADQLATMTEFWNALGRQIPELDPDQRAKLESVLAANPGRRVVPAPLLDLNGRKQVAEAAKASFDKADLNPGLEALWAPDQSWVFAKLLADPEATVKEGKKSYVLGYKTPDGEPVGGPNAYKEALVEAGQAVEASDGTVWVFPVMDAQVRAPRTRDSAGNLHARASATATPESHITMQLLQHANGTPNPTWEEDFVNEAVYEVDKKGKLGAPVDVASVNRYPDFRQVYLSYWYVDFRYDDFGLRGEESGISS